MRERIPQGGTTRVTFDAYLASDHLTAATGKTIAVTLSKNGGAFGNPAAGATNATEIGSGSYYVDVPTGDKSTAGPLIVRGTEGTIDPVKLHFDVVSDIETLNTLITAIKAKTDNLPVDPADASDIVAAFSALTTLLSSTGIALTSAERTTLAGVLLTTAGTEAYRADGAAPTLMQALCELLAHMGEVSISGTVKTLKRFDGSTTAATYTLNDASTPTAVTRAT